jgi:hypothetical protein
MRTYAHILPRLSERLRDGLEATFLGADGDQMGTNRGLGIVSGMQ